MPNQRIQQTVTRLGVILGSMSGAEKEKVKGGTSAGREALYLNIGMGDTIRASTGLAGGYPSSLTPWGTIDNSDTLEKFKRHEDVSSLDYIKGERTYRGSFTACNLKANDVLFHLPSPGGGGFGDPLKRDITIDAYFLPYFVSGRIACSACNYMRLNT